MRSMTVDKEKLEEKIGEAIGLEMAAQKAVDELSSKGLLDRGAISKLEDMKKGANSHQTQLEELVQKLLQSNGLDSGNVQDIAYCNYHFPSVQCFYLDYNHKSYIIRTLRICRLRKDFQE